MAMFGQRRKISQETFDECVQENMDEFDMERDEALKDARDQFERQGVDLSGVDLSGSSERKEERDTLRAHVALLAKNAAEGGATRGELEDALAFVVGACGKAGAADGKAAAAARAALVAAQGLSAIGRLARACVGDDDAVGDRDVLGACLDAHAAAVRGDADARDAFQFGGCVEATLRALKAALAQGDRDLAAKALRVVAAAAAKTEAVKAAFVKLKLCPLLVKAVDLAVAEKDETLAFDACAALVAAAAADDLRSVTSAAFDTSRALVDAGAVACLFQALAAFGARGRDAGAKDATLGALDALRQIAKSDDAVKLIRKAGGAKACLAALKENRTSRDRCRKLAGLLRNLAGNDDAKDAMCKDGTLEELLGAMERFLKEDAVLCEHVVACLAQMALRRPKNGTLIVEGRNGGTLVIHAMTHHKAHAGLMRQGALALRNFVGRSPEFKQPLLDAGAEAALRDAAAVSQTNVDVAYAALRDLGIDAKVKTFVPDDAGGFKEADAPMTFGAESAKNFNKSFNESHNVGSRIRDADALTDMAAKMAAPAMM